MSITFRALQRRLLPFFAYILCSKTAVFKGRHKRFLGEKSKAPSRRTQNSFALGLNVVQDTIWPVRSKCCLKRIQDLYREHGNTHLKRMLFSSTVCTLEPENLKAIRSSNTKDYDIVGV